MRAVLVSIICVASILPVSSAVPPPRAGGQELTLYAAGAEHALNRLAFGSRPGDAARVSAMGLQKWIDQQLHPERINDDALAARLRSMRNEPGSLTEMMGNGADARTLRQEFGRQSLASLTEERLLRAIYSERQLQEVLVDFWFNHFNVFARKGQTIVYIAAHERDAIRPHVLGNFRELLEATAKSPAMLFYLDNWLSTAANTPARQGQRARGLNENYARELLELHTLGVDGGYTQQDIVEVARAFTGWTIARPGMAAQRPAARRRGAQQQPEMQDDAVAGFRFVPAMHDRGAKKVLGQTIPAGGGIEDAEKVLDIVAAHPATARHIAFKLAQRFVSDTPPQSLVDRAADKFRSTRGDLREVVRVIVTSAEFSAPAAQRAKIKTPYEFVISALRATNAEVVNVMPIARTLQTLGMPLFMCQPPTGYDDTSEAWISSGALVNRINFAVSLSEGELRGVRVANTDRKALAATIGSAEFQRQ